MTELCREYLSVRSIWLHVLIVSHMHFRVNLTLYSCLNFKKRLAQNKRDIWSLSDCKVTRTHNHLVCKWTINHLAKLQVITTQLNHLVRLAKRFSVHLQTRCLWVWVPFRSSKQAISNFWKVFTIIYVLKINN